MELCSWPKSWTPLDIYPFAYSDLLLPIDYHGQHHSFRIYDCCSVIVAFYNNKMECDQSRHTFIFLSIVVVY